MVHNPSNTYSTERPGLTTMIYPLLARDGTTILEFDIEGALTLSINFLCLTITLGSVKRQRRIPGNSSSPKYRHLTYKPYSKASKFQFGIHRLTH